MNEKIINEINQYQYYRFSILDDNAKYYCKSYEDGSVAGFTKFNNIIKVMEGADPYKDWENLPSKEIPNSRIKDIDTIRVGLEFLKPR